MAGYEVKTEYGTIRVKKELVVQMLQSAIRAMNGKAVLSDAKGKPVKAIQKIRMEGENDPVYVETKEECIYLKVHVIMRFGSSIHQTAAALGKRIRGEFEHYFGETAVDIRIVVTGVATTEGITPRKIEIPV